MANKIYRAKEGYGIKGGTGSAKGEITLGLDDTYHITTMTVYAAAMGGYNLAITYIDTGRMFGFVSFPKKYEKLLNLENKIYIV